MNYVEKDEFCGKIPRLECAVKHKFRSPRKAVGPTHLSL